MNAPSNNQTPVLELDLLKTLVAIAETGNFSAAAETVFRTPSAVSMQVKKIEELVERPVFQRNSRKVTLTSDGEILLGHARRVLAMNNEILSRFVAPNVEGEVRVGAGDDFAERLLPSVLRDFAVSYPKVVVEVVMENTNELISKTKNGELDLAIIVCEAGYKDDDKAEILKVEKLVWGAKRGGIAVEQKPLPISVWEEGCAWREAALGALETAGIDYRVAFRSAYIGGQKAAVLSDLAVSPLPETSLGGDIVEVRLEGGLPELGNYALGLMVRDDPSQAVITAAQHLRANFAAGRY